MKLYHYITKPNNALKQGILSFATNDKADISYYIKRSAKTTKEEIIDWMESCFEGRSRGIRGFSEPIKYFEHSKLMFESFINNADLFEVDLQALNNDGLIDAVYKSPAMNITDDSQIVYGTDEVLEKLSSINDIDYNPVDWSKCNDAKDLRFSVVPYYVVVIKDGTIPAEYIKLI